MLRAFWFRTNKWLGYGVTAYDQNDAEGLLRALGYPAPGVEVIEIIPDVRHSDLDQNHVAANAGPIVVRGVWYPCHNLYRRTRAACLYASPMYIRFVVGGDDEHHRELTGLVTEARLLRDRGELSLAEEERLERVYSWLNSYLPCPPFSSAAWSLDAVAWFKDSATAPIRQFRILAALLEQHDLPVRMLRSRNPGKLLYEDEFQIVVEEWTKL